MPDPHKASKNGGEVEAYEWWEQHASLFEAARFEYGPLHPELYDLAAHEEFIQPMVHSAVLSCEEAARSGHAVPEEALSHLCRRYLRPIGAMLFPWLIADGTIDEHYGFVVRYKCGEDISLAEHADASVLTLNANLGISGFTGGAVAFRGTRGAVPEAVPEAVVDFADFSAGEAILHLGSHLHEALPLETGERVNLVVWLFAEHGVVRFAPYEKHERLTESERWHPSPNEQAHRRRPRSSTGAKQREWPAGAHAHVEGQAAHVAATLVDAEEAETADWKAAYDEL